MLQFYFKSLIEYFVWKQAKKNQARFPIWIIMCLKLFSSFEIFQNVTAIYHSNNMVIWTVIP